jgi:hypothetical protein
MQGILEEGGWRGGARPAHEPTKEVMRCARGRPEHIFDGPRRIGAPARRSLEVPGEEGNLSRMLGSSTRREGDVEPKVKGVAFRSVMAVVEDILGAGELERVLLSLPEDERETLESKVLHTGWYPISLYRALWRAIVETTECGDELVRAIGASAIRRDMTGVYRMVFRVFSPETVFSITTTLFGQYYDTGSVRVESAPYGARVIYEGCQGFDRTMWIELLGSGEELLRLAGAKDPRLEIIGGGTGPSCEVEARWS